MYTQPTSPIRIYTTYVYITYKSYIQHSEGSKVHVAIAYICCTHTWRAAGEHIRTHSVQLCCTKGVCGRKGVQVSETKYVTREPPLLSWWRDPCMHCRGRRRVPFPLTVGLPVWQLEGKPLSLPLTRLRVSLGLLSVCCVARQTTVDHGSQGSCDVVYRWCVCVRVRACIRVNGKTHQQLTMVL